MLINNWLFHVSFMSLTKSVLYSGSKAMIHVYLTQININMNRNTSTECLFLDVITNVCYLIAQPVCVVGLTITSKNKQ